MAARINEALLDRVMRDTFTAGYLRWAADLDAKGWVEANQALIVRLYRLAARACRK